jgi:hypothetical protein
MTVYTHQLIASLIAGPTEYAQTHTRRIVMSIQSLVSSGTQFHIVSIGSTKNIIMRHYTFHLYFIHSCALFGNHIINEQDHLFNFGVCVLYV